MISSSANIYFLVCSLLVLISGVTSIVLKRKAQLVISQKDEIKIINRRALSQKSELVIIELDSERFLLSHSGDRIGLISKLVEKDTLSSRSVPFDSLLDDTLSELEEGNR
jgi:flagellar biogenesis protein FliO